MALKITKRLFTSNLLKKSFLPLVQQCSTATGGVYSNEKTTHFGYKTVTEEEKKNKGKILFSKVNSKILR